ncbi:MAG TPA: hypothetical protein VHX39_00715 [Acetobacteraceae bacterium]|jgi:hypothetical protein|nr:hypothetical protein [Acetobacteraceae bacterium]HEX4367851.1 hypothetical protein [Rhodopila sp.]
MRLSWLIVVPWLLLSGGVVVAGPQAFDLHLDVPPIVADSKAPASCTVTYLIDDTANNDVFAERMRIASAETDTPINNRMPCPANVPPRVGERALDACQSRAGDPKQCVFADMARGFQREPNIDNTSEIASRCSSDKFSDIGVACWMSGKLSVCDVGCGNSPKEAVAQAQARCSEKQQHSCPVTATVPIPGP